MLICFQMNYDFLRKCVASAPVTPMAAQTWQGIIGRLAPPLLSSPLSTPFIPTLYKEIHSLYEDTIRKTTIKMTLVKPTVQGLEPDTPLHSEQL